MKSLKCCFLVIGCVLVCLSPRAGASACASFGQTGTGTIGSAGQENTCTLSANANDVVDFTVVTTSGSVSPEVCVYSSTGTQLACAANRNAFGGCSGGSVIELDTLSVPATETYTVTIGDCSNTNTGNYAYYSQRTNNPSGAASLPFEGVESGTIGSAALDNTYTFSADANDVVDFTMVTTSGSVSPRIRLYSPSGALLNDQANRNAFGGCSGGSVVELDAVTLATSGTYTVLVGDCGDTSTGNYNIYSQRLNNPGGALNLPFARVQSGTIVSAAQDNTYTFSANANDVVDFTMVTTSGSMSPRIRLYSPSGALLDDQANRNAFGGCSGGSVVELDAVTLATSGTYTVLVGDCGDTSLGNYDLYLQRTDDPAGPLSLPFGQAQAGTISSEAQDNTYTFSADVNDVFDFTMVATKGSLSPRIRLYDPNGKLLYDQANRNAFGGCSGGAVTELNTAGPLALSGTYTVLVGDCGDTNTGSYDIYTQRTNNPSGAATLVFAQTQTGSTASAAQNNSYIFSGSANDVVDFTMVTTSGSLSPRIRLYSPAGALISDAANRNAFGGCSGGSVLELNTVKLPASGTFTMLVTDCGDSSPGNYTIYGQRTNSPFGPAPFVWGGSTQSGEISSAAQDNTYTFGGSDSNVVDFTMTATSGGLSPRIRLYNPDGSEAFDDANRNAFGGCSGGSTLGVQSVTLTQNGIYTMLVGDCSDTNTGNYNISGLCFGTCPAMPAIAWTTPAPISYGTPLGATQLNATASVAGTFVYNPPVGTVLPLGPQNLSVVFTPTDTTDYSTAEDSVQLTVIPGPEVSPTKLSFVSQVIDTTSAAKTVTLKNGGTTTLTDILVSATGDFAISANTCASTLAAGKSCKVSVTFTPTQADKRTGTLSFSDSAPNSPQTVALSGTGVEPAKLTPASTTYAKQKVGTTSAAKTFTLTNNQTVELTGMVITPSGDFAVSATTCTTSLAAKKNCRISMTFTPTETGTRTGQLSVSDSASNSPQTASLKGTGD